jgi:DNA-binding protein YbaB
MSEAEFAQALEDARNRLKEIRASGPEPVQAQGGPTRGTGEAQGGLVRAIAYDGRLESVSLDARAMSLPVAELSKHLSSAANTALDQARGATSDSMPDLASLARSLAQVQAEGMRAMQEISSAIQEALNTFGPETGMTGDVPTEGMNMLFEETMASLDKTRSALSAAGADDGPFAEGWDQDRYVHVGVDVSKRITLVEISPEALGLHPADLGQNVALAANAALDNADRMPGGGVAPDLDPDELSERVQQLQNMSLDSMRTFTGSLTDIMSRIHEP